MIKQSPENWINDINKIFNPPRIQTKENVYFPNKKTDNVNSGKASKTIYPTDKKISK